MNRKEFIDRLRVNLQGLPMSEIQDILSDYEEHFDIGLSKGKSEEEIARELGDTRDIASNYRTSYKSNYNDEIINTNTTNSNDNSRKFLMILLVGFFNLIIVFGPFMAVLGVLMSIYGIGLSFIIGGIALLFGLPFSFINFIPSPHILTSLSFGIGLGALGFLGIILAVYLTKSIYQLTVKYIKWNIEIINKGGF